uniref:glutathione transferase n=2 Tax=Aegilops tauschii subsp. strangulata TaxID=200361 RepID=A0A452XZR9_AEGTS
GAEQTKQGWMAPAVKVYGWAVSPFVARPLLCLEEAGVEYELVSMSRAAGDHRQPDFLARNPFGQVPVLEDGDLTIFESRAVARHVLRNHKPELLGSGSPESAAMVDVWLEVEAHQHQTPAGTIVMQCILTPFLGCKRDQAAIDENAAKLTKLFDVYEARLSASRYLAGDSLSLADLSHFPLMRYFMDTEYASLVEERPHVKAWWEELKVRPAAKRVTEFMPPNFGFGKTAEK